MLPNQSTGNDPHESWTQWQYFQSLKKVTFGAEQRAWFQFPLKVPDFNAAAWVKEHSYPNYIILLNLEVIKKTDIELSQEMTLKPSEMFH